MLFVYRPPQTWMPYRVPRPRTQQEAYNLQLQEQFAATRRVAPPVPDQSATASVSRRDSIGDLKELAALHRSGALSDTEFSAAKAKVLGLDHNAS